MLICSVQTETAKKTQAVAKALAEHLNAGDVLVLDGALGAGKTTFTQGLGEALNVRGPVASPTFVIAREHPNLGDGPDLVHVDAYRLDGEFDIDDLDLDADIDHAITVVEWGRDRVEQLSDSHLLIELIRHEGAGAETDEDGNEERHIRFTGTGPRWTEAAAAALKAELENL